MRVGTGSGLLNIMSPLADPVTGRRWVVGPGNASESLLWHLRGLSPGTYYWSVQAIDHAGVGSTFGPEQSFVIADPRPRILSLTPGSGALVLRVEFGLAGSFSVMTSPDLSTWTDSETANYEVGPTNISVPLSADRVRFIRLHKNP